MFKKYSEGICHDGVAIIEDGEMITIEKILKLLNDKSWISIDEKLPDENSEYLVKRQAGYIEHYPRPPFFTEQMNYEIIKWAGKITHWMPL